MTPMAHLSGGLLFTMVVATLVVAQPVSGQVSMTDLGTLGGCCSGASGINARGQVVGTSVTASGELQPFLWENGVLTDLGTLGGDFSLISFLDINERGQIVGTFENATSSEIRSFFWEDGTMTDLGTLGGSRTFVSGINERGQVVGGSTTALGDFRAFLWENGILTDLGTLGGAWSSASGINARGQVVGTSVTASGEGRAFIWQNGTFEDIGPDLNPTAINARGQVVGQLFTASEIHAFLWENGTLVSIPLGCFDGILLAKILCPRSLCDEYRPRESPP